MYGLPENLELRLGTDIINRKDKFSSEGENNTGLTLTRQDLIIIYQPREKIFMVT